MVNIDSVNIRLYCDTSFASYFSLNAQKLQVITDILYLTSKDCVVLQILGAFLFSQRFLFPFQNMHSQELYIQASLAACATHRCHSLMKRTDYCLNVFAPIVSSPYRCRCNFPPFSDTPLSCQMRFDKLPLSYYLQQDKILFIFQPLLPYHQHSSPVSFSNIIKQEVFSL